eukprot:897779_1
MGACCAALNAHAKHLQDNNILVTKNGMSSINKLQKTNIICVDQYLLQTNIMTCQHLFYDLKQCECDTEVSTNAIRGDFYQDNKKRYNNFLKLIRCAALNNNAFNSTVDSSSYPQWTGDSADAIAIAKFCSGHINDEYKMDLKEYREKHPTEKVKHFPN